MELLVSMGLAMVVLAAVTNTFIAQSKFYNAQEQVNEMQQNARAVMDLMNREVKQAGWDPVGTAITTSNGIPYDTTKLQLLSDLNGNGAIAGSDEDIEYTFDAPNLRIERKTNGTTTTMAENIESFTFEYLKADGTAATTTAEIRQVRVVIRARTSKRDPDFNQNNGHRTYQLTSLITPQNLCYKGGSCP